VFDRASLRLLFVLDGPGLPVWSVAFSRDGTKIITGGTDRRVRFWDAATGRHIGPVGGEDAPDVPAHLASHPGAEVFRACIACHTLSDQSENRAGPTLWRVFGRRVGGLAGYDYSPALRGGAITWSPETVAKLFEVGPNSYLPGTKMPEQVLGAAERAALVDFLARVAE
jgi:cytochrome c